MRTKSPTVDPMTVLGSSLRRPCKSALLLVPLALLASGCTAPDPASTGTPGTEAGWTPPGVTADSQAGKVALGIDLTKHKNSSFRTESGNITCAASADPNRVTCIITDQTWSMPESKDGSCKPYKFMEVTAERAGWACSEQAKSGNYEAMTIKPGSNVKIGGIVCDVATKVDVTCHHLKNKHKFSLGQGGFEPKLG